MNAAYGRPTSSSAWDSGVKVVFVNRYFAPDHSATSQILSDLAFFLVKAGLQVHVITSRQLYDDASARLRSEEVIADVPVHRVWTSTFGRANLIGRACDYFSFYLSAGVRLVFSLRPGDVVIAKTDPPLLSVVVSVCARLRGARQINWLQDLFPEVAAAVGVWLVGGKLGRILIAMRDWSLQRAQMNVTIGDSMAERVRARGVPAQRVQVIPNWCDGQAIQPLDRDANPLRSEWGLAEKFVIGYSGNMGRVHDLKTVVSAAELMRDDSGVCFLFIGAGKQRDWIQSEANRLRLDNVLFEPYQSRQRLGFSLAVPDVHIVSLLPELEGLSVPSKFYGVAAAGRPTIFVGDPQGAIGSIVRENECGVCVRQGDAAGLATAVGMVRSDVQLRDRMGYNARRLFERRYDQSIANEDWRLLLCAVSASATPAKNASLPDQLLPKL
jgi:colanic acid biosynthesis glycosyl transferase WcaI